MPPSKPYRYNLKGSRSDRAYVLRECQEDGSALQGACEELKGDKEIVAAACKHGGYLIHATKELQEDRDFVLQVCELNGFNLRGASDELKGDEEIVIAAGYAGLEHGSKKFRSDRKVVLAACQRSGHALRYASGELQDDEEIVWAAVQADAFAIQYASGRLQGEKDLALAACARNPSALQAISEKFRKDKDVVIAAVSRDPECLKFALGGLNQDPDCLVVAGLWDKDYAVSSPLIGASSGDKVKIVMSTRFSLDQKSDSSATQFTVLLKQHQYIQDGGFVVYSPNAFSKSTCDPEWTRMDWPCRGTTRTCRKDVASLKTGEPKPESCWRYSFRYQLEEARRTRGFMIQLSDFSRYHGNILGDGQKIETEMAKAVGTKVFRVKQAGFISDRVIFNPKDIDLIVSQISSWYGHNCQDMSLQEITIEYEMPAGAAEYLALY